MAHCPACGTDVAAPTDAPFTAASAQIYCPRCGARVQPKGPQQTLLGISGAEVALSGTQVIGDGARGRDAALHRTQLAGTPAGAAGTAAAATAAPAPRGHYDPLTDPQNTMATIVDVPAFDVHAAIQARQAGASAPQATLLGVARPGIAPLRPGVAKTPVDDPDPPPNYEPLDELGATQRPPRGLRQVLVQPRPDGRAATHPLARLRVDGARDRMKAAPSPAGAAHGPKPPPSTSRRGLWVLLAALALSTVAVLVALLMPSAPPLRAQIRSGEAGSEVIDVTCESCPDGTVLRVREAEATVQAGRATIPLGSPLAIGDTPLKVAIDRPGGGRDEKVTLPLRVAYRIRPDLGTLDADHPSIQIIVEAMDGAAVTLDGEPVPLVDGRAVHAIDVTKDLLGASSDASALLTRKVTFVVKPPDGVEEKGVVAVSVPILPLTIDAPGIAIVTDKPSFVLAGRTVPEAEIVAAGRSLGLAHEGSFSQTMNVSSVGATVVEVRARLKGRAPRLARISIERVTSLDAAASAFKSRGPLDYAGLTRDPRGAVGKAIALEGELVDARSGGGVTTLVLQADSPGCSSEKCLVRLVLGRADVELARGDRIRAFGTVIGRFEHEGRVVPDVALAFATRDGKPTGSQPLGGSGQKPYGFSL